MVCVVGAAARTLHLLDRVRSDESVTRKAFLERRAALDHIRSQIYLSGTYVRDFLLSPDPRAAAAQASRLATLERETRGAVEAYARILEPAEHEAFQALRSEIEEYWRVLDHTLQWSPEERSRLRYSFFYDQLVPRRTAMLQIADRIAAANERGLNRAEERMAASAERLRRSLVLTFALTLAGGLVLAGATIVFTLRLERDLERRGADLQELSTRLLRAQESERRSLARELHDEIGQSLSAILMEAEGAECAEQPADAREHLAAIRRLAERTVKEVRDLALLLRPSMLDDLGLIPALHWHARETSKRTGLRVAVTASEDTDDLPEEHKTCIYRSIQEAVNNSAQHANARAVEVVVRRQPGSVSFSVQDDGAGFDPHFARGLGLLGMEERVRRLGGAVTIDSQPGRGTRITAELPITEVAQGNGQQARPYSAG